MKLEITRYIVRGPPGIQLEVPQVYSERFPRYIVRGFPGIKLEVPQV